MFQISKSDFSLRLDVTYLNIYLHVSTLYISTFLNKDVKLKVKLWLIVLNYYSKIDSSNLPAV